MATPDQASNEAAAADEVLAYDKEHPAVGTWLGTATSRDGATPFVILRVSQDEKNDWTVKITALAAGMMGTACSDIESDGDSFAFSVAPLSLRLAGTVSADGQSFTGQITRTDDGDGEPTPPQSFDLHRTLMPNDAPEPLAFSGDLQAMGMEIPMTIVLARTPGGNWVGHLDIPMQQLREFPFTNFKTADGGKITADLPVPGGAAISVTLDELEQRLSGFFLQAGMEMEMDFARDMNYSYRELARPQTPVRPLPYEEIEVTAPHPLGFSLGGTLTVPNNQEFGEGPFPVAVLITGSGAQDRNESLLGHQPFYVLSDYLTRHGIAVMRYDDRGVGASSVEDMSLVLEGTSEDFATDALAVVNHIKTMDVIDPERIGLVGHSEGGMIAPLVGQMTDDIAFMVFMAGPGVLGRDLLVKQTELFMEVAGVDAASIKEQSAIRRKLYEMVADGETGEPAEQVLYELFALQEDDSEAQVTQEQLDAALDQARQTLFNKWMTYFLAYDPAPALAATTCPVLALNGTLDLQVWHEQNLDAIERTIKDAGGDITIIRYDGMNHLFQKCKTGAFAEYITIETTIEEQVMADMAEWIKTKMGAPG